MTRVIQPSRSGAHKLLLLILLGISCAPLLWAQPARANPLPSWSDGAAKRAILDFVTRVTTAGSKEFVPVDERIATFDNDGTLWSEQPIYFQVTFALDRVRALAPLHPEWKRTQPFKAVLDGDFKSLTASGEKGFFEILTATHTGMTTDEFAASASEWIATSRHPRFKRPYTDLVYQPMLEWTAAGSGARFMGLVHHTDAEREWAYDRSSSIGRLDKALDEASERGWLVVDMKSDWKKVYAFE